MKGSPYQYGKTYINDNLNLADLLEGEKGTFNCTALGVRFSVECKPGHSITKLIPIGFTPNWQIERIANDVATDEVTPIRRTAAA